MAEKKTARRPVPAKSKATAKKAPPKKTSPKKTAKPKKAAPKKRPAAKKAAKKPARKSRPAKKRPEPVGDTGIVIIDDDIEIDQDRINEERRAYLEEARSQEAFD